MMDRDAKMTVVLHLFVDTLSVGGDLVEQMKETKKKAN